MKKIYVFFLLSLLATACNPQQIGKSVECPQDITIEAREGDNHVTAVMNGERYVLFPQGNYLFTKESPILLVFDSYNRREPAYQTDRLIYTHPSTSMPQRGVIEVRSDKGVYTCNIDLY